MLDLVGDRWTLLVVRDLMFFGRHEFKEFLRADEGIASNILSARLKLLVESGLAEMAPHSSNKVKKLYYLTELGKSLLPMLLEMILWADEHSPFVKIPPPVISQIRLDRESFIRETLDTLAKWEAENLSAQSTD